MTVLGWDASHYDGRLSTAILARAKAEGVRFFTHKIAEGAGDTEGTYDDTALAAARDAGIEFVGGYLVPRTNASVAAQVDEWLALADAGEPWWRSFPGWFWQIDLERWSYDNVPASFGIACAQELRRRTVRWTILYASHGQYGDQLTGWDGPLWNADYVSGPAAGFQAMYPGDGWQPLHGTWRGGWTPYSGKPPTILQYTPAATIAGLPTCDADAFRGTVDQLRALINPKGWLDMLSDQDQADLYRRIKNIDDAWFQTYQGKDEITYRPGDGSTEMRTVPNVLKQLAAAVQSGGQIAITPDVAQNLAAALAEPLSKALVDHADNPLSRADLDNIKQVVETGAAEFFRAKFGQ